MDFSSLVISEFSLYIIGALIIVVLIALLFTIFSKKEAPTLTPVAEPVGGAASPIITSVAVGASQEVLPSTEIVEQMPTVTTSTSLPATEASQAVPPLSAWKPSQKAAPIPVANDILQSEAPASPAAQEEVRSTV